MPDRSLGWGRLEPAPGSPANCQLTIGSQAPTVLYCGAAPGLIIDQLNFEYPAGAAPAGTPYVDASLTINSVTGHFRVPGPAFGH